MNQHPHLAIGQQVVLVLDDKTHKGTITHVYNEDVARIEFDGGFAVAGCSTKKEPNTFHFEQASPKEEHKKH